MQGPGCRVSMSRPCAAGLVGVYGQRGHRALWVSTGCPLWVSTGCPSCPELPSWVSTRCHEVSQATLVLCGCF
jgi:hypothetical protein